LVGKHYRSADIAFNAFYLFFIYNYASALNINGFDFLEKKSYDV